jgi:hypothetical protein
MKLNLKYNATKVDEIEKETGLPIDQAINDSRISNLILFVQKGFVDENGKHGVTRAVALDVIDNFLSEKDKDELTLDIMEALVDAGFLSRKLDVDKMREANNKRQEQLNKELERITTAK